MEQNVLQHHLNLIFSLKIMQTVYLFSQPLDSSKEKEKAHLKLNFLATEKSSIRGRVLLHE